MNLLVLGATGGTGRQVVSQALEAGHHVTAFVRTPAKLPLANDRLQVIAGSATEARDLTTLFQGQHAVISALGTSQSLKANGLLERAVPLILSGMQAAGVKRLVFTSAIGVGSAYQ